MHVLEVCSRFYPALGGGETYTWMTAKSLVSRGHKVTVWTSDLYSCVPWIRVPRNRETIEGVDVVRMRGVSLPADRFREYLFIPGQTLGWAGDSPPFDVVHLQGYGTYSAYGQIPPWYFRKFRFVLSTITLPEQGLIRRVYDGLIGRKLLRAAQHVVCLTSAERHYFMQLGCPESKISLIPPGPAIDLQAVVAGTGLPTRIQLEPGSRFVLSFGRLARNKGLATLIAAAAPLLLSDPRLFLIIAGENHGVLPELTAQVRRLKLQSKVLFPGRISDSEAVQLIARCTLFVFPSEWGEAYGMTLLTAMQLGRPVVATNLPGAIDMVQPDETGLVVPCADIASLREAMRRLLSNENLSSRIGEEARRRTEGITWEAVATKMSEVLERAAVG